MTDAHPEIEVRIGDTERRAVDEWLHRAVGEGQLTLGEYEERAALVWGARTRADLEAVTRDLPGAVSSAPVPVEGVRPRCSVAVMSEDRLSGPVAPGEDVHAYALMGSSKVDLVQADLPREVHVRAVAVMGDVRVVVPDGATVHLSGGALMGDRSVKVAPPVPGGPVVHVAAGALMGSVSVRSQPGPSPAGVLLDKVRQPAGLVPAPVGRRHGAVRSGSGVARRRGRGRWRGRLVGLALVAGVGVAVASTGTTAVMGSQTVFAQAGDEVNARVFMGSVTVVVPDDVGATKDGIVVMGSADCNVACGQGQGDTRVDVDVLGTMGSVKVLTKTEYDRRQVDLGDPDDE